MGSCKCKRMSSLGICVIVIVMQCMNDECVVRKVEGEVLPALAYSYQKALRGPPSSACQSSERFTVNSAHAFMSHALRRDLGFNPAIFGTETSD